MKHKSWWIFQGVQLAIFLALGTFLVMRGIDGHGAVQTLDIKLISIGVWVLFYLGLLAVESIIFAIIQAVKRL